MRKINAAGLKLIKEFEGRKLAAYRDSVGVLTIGYGHTSMAGPPDVTPGLKISQYEAEEILAHDLGKYELAVARAVKVPLSDNQFAALVSLCFNIGPGAFAKSSLVRYLNARDYDEARAQFVRWNKAGNPLRVLAGLTRRRLAEAALFASEAPSVPTGDAPPPYLPPDVPRTPAPSLTLWERFLRSLKGR
jgi:lysozyme